MPYDKRQTSVQRWVHQAPGNDLDAELGQVFRALLPETPLDDAELARVGRRVARASRRRSRPLFRLLPVVLAVLLGGTGAAFAEWLRPGLLDARAWIGSRTPSAPPADTVDRGPSQQRSPAKLSASEPPVVLPSLPVESPPPPPHASESAARPSTVALESELLQRALEKLRRDHDGVGALAALDVYGARFPGGLLALEAAVARIDALLLLGRRAEALRALESLPLARVGRRTELQLLRAELYAERDCRMALPDFDAVLAAAAPAPLGERALYGRATCRARLADAAGARADLARYLARFPQGRFVEQVRARLSAE